MKRHNCNGNAQCPPRLLPSPVFPHQKQCFVLSLSHLSSFLSTARSRSAHRAVATLTRELKRDVQSAELAAEGAVAAAAKARKGAREASAEALAATARAASAAASARNEGSFLLEEVWVPCAAEYGAAARDVRRSRCAPGTAPVYPRNAPCCWVCFCDKSLGRSGSRRM